MLPGFWIIKCLGQKTGGSRFESVEEHAQFVDQHMVDQSTRFRAHKNHLNESFFEAVEQARQELHTSMSTDLNLAVFRESQRIQAQKQQEATAWEKRTHQQFVNEFNRQVALNKKAIEAQLRTLKARYQTNF